MGGVHDMGGSPAGPIDRGQHEVEDWERLADAITTALDGKGIKTTDEHRRAQESLPPEEYASLSYYERWVAATETLLVEKGVLTREDDRREGESARMPLGRGITATFRPGKRVRVRPGEKPGHVRTPGYLKGKPGWIESVIGEFPNPEDLAYGLSGLPKSPLYKVGFRQSDLWEDYEGPADDHLYADLYEQWLEPGEGGSA